jgi:hypothetical protein
MVSIGTPRPAEMPRHPADYTTAGRQRWESKDEGKWAATFGRARRTDRGRTIKRWRADGTSYTVREDKDNG